MKKTVTAAVLAAASPRAIAGRVRAEGNPAEMIRQMQTTLNNTLQENNKRFEDLQKTWADFRAENESKSKDVITEGKLKAMNEAIDKQIAELKASTKDISKIDASISKIERELDEMNKKIAASRLGGGKQADPRASNPAFAEYCEKFDAFFRRGEDDPRVGGKYALAELEVKAAMSTQSNPDGGFTVTPEMERAIDETVKEVSPMRQYATVRRVGMTNTYKKLVNKHGTASGWVGEEDSRPQTLGPNLSELEYPVMEIYAMPAATQGLLDDSSINMAEWIASEVELEFAQKEGAAFIAGDGTKKPKGILAGYPLVADASWDWGKIGYFGTGVNGAFAADPNGDKALIDVYTGLKSAYRRNGTWMMNRKTIGAIRKLKDSDGQPLIGMSLQRDGMVEELLGRPLEEMPDMPDMGTGTYSVAFGDFRRGYLIVDRMGVRVLRDPYSSKPYVLFYTTKRVGGGVQNFEAIKLLRFS